MHAQLNLKGERAMFTKHSAKVISITFLVLLGLALSKTSIAADQKYNPYTQKWETVAPDSVLKYNPYEREWKYASPDAKSTYNPHNRSWDMAPPDAVQKYNPYTREWETTSPDSVIKYNPYELISNLMVLMRL